MHLECYKYGTSNPQISREQGRIKPADRWQLPTIAVSSRGMLFCYFHVNNSATHNTFCDNEENRVKLGVDIHAFAESEGPTNAKDLQRAIDLSPHSRENGCLKLGLYKGIKRRRMLDEYQNIWDEAMYQKTRKTKYLKIVFVVLSLLYKMDDLWWTPDKLQEWYEILHEWHEITKENEERNRQAKEEYFCSTL